MFNNEFLKGFIYYFIKLPILSLRIQKGRFSDIEKVAKICPERPGASSHRELIKSACEKYPFLKGYNPENLFNLYNAISALRESDVFLYPFLSKDNVKSWNIFYGLKKLSESYRNGPVLILYSHTGSYYQVLSATGLSGFKVYPVAYDIDTSTMNRPFRWLFNLNIQLSMRHFSGGCYLYAKSPLFLKTIKKIVSRAESSLVFSPIDLPKDFITDKRIEVDFLDRRALLPYKFLEFSMRNNLKVFTAFPYIDVVDGRVKRVVKYEVVQETASPSEILQVYADRLDRFIRQRPEQLLTLINLDGFFK